MGAQKNTEDIDLDDEDEDAEDAPAADGEAELEEVAVPDEVFGKLKEKVAADGEEAAPKGALDRFKKKQRVQM
eukprot:2376687-Pyramimonas_sp.AAC.1